MATSPAGPFVQEEPPTMMAWPRMVRGPSTPSSCIHATGVLPWRATISLNSTAGGAVCDWCGTRAASARGVASRSRSGVQVSIWAGAKKQRTRPPWAPSWRAWDSTARRSPARPSGSFPPPPAALAPSGEPAPGAEGLAHVAPQAVVRGAVHHVLAVPADLHHGGHAAAEQLGHREVHARPPTPVVLGLATHRQHPHE